MFGQRYESRQSINIFIAALNEEEGVGATISELSDNINAKRILLIMVTAMTAQLKLPKNMGQKYFSKTGKGKGNVLAKAVGCMGEDS